MKRLSSLAFLALLVAGLFLASFMPDPQTVLAQGYSNTNAYAYWVPPGACSARTSGSTTGTQGLTVTGASYTPVMQVQTSAGEATDTYVCNITPPNTIITSGNGILIVDAVFMYSPQSGLRAPTAVLASGTMNSAQVFSYIAYPAAGAGEVASTVTPVRADAGTLVFGPVEVHRLQRELESLEDYLVQASIRESGKQAPLPKTSRLLEALAGNNGFNLLLPPDRKQLTDFLLPHILQIS